VGRGKLEIQNQDSHFSTAQISLRRKEKGRLHKTLDAPISKDATPVVGAVQTLSDGVARGQGRFNFRMVRNPTEDPYAPQQRGPL
jgi:hypothetical protein